MDFAAPDAIVTDIGRYIDESTVLFLKKMYPGKKVYCQGTKSLVKELIDLGIKVTEEVKTDVDIVLVGFDTELTSSKLRKTCELLPLSARVCSICRNILC